MVTLHRRRVKSAVYQWDKGRRTYSKGIQKEYKKNTKKSHCQKRLKIQKKLMLTNCFYKIVFQSIMLTTHFSEKHSLEPFSTNQTVDIK